MTKKETWFGNLTSVEYASTTKLRLDNLIVVVQICQQTVIFKLVQTEENQTSFKENRKRYQVGGFSVSKMAAVHRSCF